MRITITRLRQDLFNLADRALEGEPLEFTHKGVVFKVTPETKTSKLAKLTGQTVVSAESDWEKDSQALRREMESEWEKDWSEL